MDLIQAASQVGFPIAVTTYLLYERSRYNVDVTDKLARITSILDLLEHRL